jgi:SAM-dependent methyltransferase
MTNTTSAGRGAVAPGVAPLAPALFGGAVLFSAALVFMVEPMVGRLVLPMLGGSPAVWNTALAFFQTALLVGYGYAHLLQRLGSVRRQAIVHGLVLIAAAATLPLHISQTLGPPEAQHPVLWLLGVLALSVGAPFAALSATAPLVQAWYAKVRAGEADAGNPYVLYVASNLGSLLALLAYPVIVEPVLRLKVQTLGWSVAYAGFVLVMGLVALTASATHEAATAALDAPAKGERPTWRDRLTWLGLATAPSSLMLGVTTHITTDIASAPFLWVAPLALYLLTFIIAFQERPAIRPQWALVMQAAAVLACLVTLNLPVRQLPSQVGLQLLGFFLTALVCHQALAARRPTARWLTEFYLLMSLGGVIGGSFNAFVAPVIFNGVVEYPAVLILAGLARPWGKGSLTLTQIGLLIAAVALAGASVALNGFLGFGAWVKLLIAGAVIATFSLRDRALVFVWLTAVLTFTLMRLAPQPDILRAERGFFGVLKVMRFDMPFLGPTRILSHGTTLHGAQSELPALHCRPLVYYAPTTPIGQVFESARRRSPALRIGVIGMGTGSVAAFTRPTDGLRFFEIDPLVVRISTNPANFSFINGCAKGRIDWVLGDARQTLAHEPANAFDILLVDAFSSDSVPAHLLTVEAMKSYLAHIKPDGVVIMHLSNRNLELMTPVAAAASAAGGAALQQHYRSPPKTPLYADSAEDAVIVARTRAALAPYISDPRWTLAQSNGVRTWTDDYTNLFGALVRHIEQPPS